MFLQKTMKFHSVIGFEKNGLTLNYWFSSILSNLTPKSEEYMNIYTFGNSKPNLEENGGSIDFSRISKCQAT